MCNLCYAFRNSPRPDAAFLRLLFQRPRLEGFRRPGTRVLVSSLPYTMQQVTSATCNMQQVALTFCMHHVATMFHVKLAVMF